MAARFCSIRGMRSSPSDARVEIPRAFPYMGRLMTAAMPIPGLIDPVPVPRPDATADGARVNLIGLSKAEMRGKLIEAGLDGFARGHFAFGEFVGEFGNGELVQHEKFLNADERR